MPRLNFIPQRDGWHFSNGFQNRILPGVLYGVQTGGLCGGMAMTALDYWRAGLPIPAHETSDLPGGLPDEASILRRYIYDRQMNSLLTSAMFTRWVISPFISPANFYAWATGPEFDTVVRQLNMNRPVMLGLWSMTKGANTGGHQVVCYGWDENPRRLYLYDPNNPDDETVLTPESATKGCRLRGTTKPYDKYYRGYFFTDVYNWNQNPPYAPPYRDLTLTSGLSTTPSGPDANVNSPLALAATVQNVGEYPSRFRAFCVWARDPAGRNIDAMVGGIEAGFQSLNPGQSRTIARNAPSFGVIPGTHTIGVSKESLTGHWQDIPLTNTSAVSTKQLQLRTVRPKLPDKLVSVKESSADVDTGVVLQPGDEFALHGSGAIWAGVWFTGINGPEGWTDRIETNANSPLHNTPDARPFSLLGRFEGEGYFYIGQELGRRTFNSSSQRRLWLRINDNTPGNGSGAFQCLIEVWR